MNFLKRVLNHFLDSMAESRAVRRFEEEREAWKGADQTWYPDGRVFWTSGLSVRSNWSTNLQFGIDWGMVPIGTLSAGGTFRAITASIQAEFFKASAIPTAYFGSEESSTETSGAAHMERVLVPPAENVVYTADSLPSLNWTLTVPPVGYP